MRKYIKQTVKSLLARETIFELDRLGLLKEEPVRDLISRLMKFL